MGVDVRILLPPDARVRDVADVIGAAAGLKWEDVTWSDGYVYKRLKGLTVQGIEAVPGSADIVLKGDLVDGEPTHNVMFHYESESGRRSLIPRSTAFWIAVGVRLVKFFGGKLDFDDSDDTDWNLSCNRPRLHNDPEDGAPWLKFEAELQAVQPITAKELAWAEKYAAYKQEK